MAIEDLHDEYLGMAGEAGYNACAVCGQWHPMAEMEYDEEDDAYYCKDHANGVDGEALLAAADSLLDDLSAAQEADYDAFLAQWDDDPSPYDGNYSEE